GPLMLILALVLPTADKAKPRRDQGYIVDCASHSAWHEPQGWTTFRSGGETLAVSPDKHAVLLRTEVATERDRTPATPGSVGRAMGGRIAHAEVTWGTPTVKKRNKYARTTTIDGTASDVTVRVVQHDRGYGKDIVWVEVIEGKDRDDALATMDKQIAA